MNSLSNLCGVHPHRRNKAPRYDKTGKQWSVKQKGINISPLITAAEAACGRRDDGVHWGTEKSSLDHLKAARRLCPRAAFPASEPAGREGTQSPPG